MLPQVRPPRWTILGPETVSGARPWPTVGTHLSYKATPNSHVFDGLPATTAEVAARMAYDLQPWVDQFADKLLTFGYLVPVRSRL